MDTECACRQLFSLILLEAVDTLLRYVTYLIAYLLHTNTIGIVSHAVFTTTAVLPFVS